MKIKCPFCKRESDSDRDLREHLVLDHEVSQAMIYFTKLLFKIHEIIAECEEPHDDSVHLKLTNKDINNIIIQNLKSLLDSKK